MGDVDTKRDSRNTSSVIWRFVITAIVVAVTAFLTPGFTLSGLWAVLIAALVISLLDYGVEKLMKVDASPFGRGFKGFLISVIILYVAQFFVPGMTVTILGAIIAAIIIGIIDAIIPGRAM